MENSFSENKQLGKHLEALILRRFGELKATNVAEALGWSDTKMHNWKTEKLEEAAKVISALGITFASDDDVVILSSSDYKALKVMAKHGMTNFINSLPEA